MNVSPDRVPQIYKALRAFDDILYSDDALISIKMKEGKTMISQWNNSIVSFS